ncbi:M24 family metallopeptidase [Shewanella sp. SE1]|nr:M24 family metallopeptidase [Shewanella sp. SE1]
MVPPISFPLPKRAKAAYACLKKALSPFLKARPASKGQYGYAYVLNSSVNEVVCHGVQSEQQLLKASDIVNLDITLEKDGFIADSSKMYLMPQASSLAKRLELRAGMWFTIEPMINQGGAKIKTKKDGWTVVTRDKKLSAQWEHSILVTDTGYEVLPLRDEER